MIRPYFSATDGDMLIHVLKDMMLAELSKDMRDIEQRRVRFSSLVISKHAFEHHYFFAGLSCSMRIAAMKYMQKKVFGVIEVLFSYR